jgi:uncharacterized protein YggE
LHITPLNNNNSLLKFTLIGLTLSLSGLFACMFFSSDNNTAFAQQQQRQLQTLNPTHNITTTNATNTLSLTGTATTTVKPDKVTVSLGVETTNKTADAALAANSKIMNQVLGVLKAAGVKDNETSTSSFSISPNYNYSQPSVASRITGFTVSNSIQIQSTNINSTSKWIDAAIAAGANTVDRIDFALSNKKLEETKNTLIVQSMQDARAKADIVASAAGMKVVGIRSISLNELAIQPPPSPIPLAKQSLAATEARPTPIMSGQEEVTTNMGVIFLIQ